MGRRGITGADVVRAYVTLIREGRVAGPTNIRLELGRGSYSTIVSHLKRLALVQPERPVRAADTVEGEN
jgi:hypothetical protein